MQSKLIKKPEAVKPINEVKYDDIIKKDKIEEIKENILSEQVYIRYKWTKTTKNSTVEKIDNKDTLVISNYFQEKMISILEHIISTTPSKLYLICSTYSYKSLTKHDPDADIYYDTQIGITGSGINGEDIKKEFQEEVGLSSKSVINFDKIKRKTKLIHKHKTIHDCNFKINRLVWNNYLYDVHYIYKQLKYKKDIMASQKDIYNKKKGNKVCGFIYGTLDQLMKLYSIDEIVHRRDANDIQYIYGFDFVSIDFILQYLKWYYHTQNKSTKTRIIF
jgi:hypothetical protein